MWRTPRHPRQQCPRGPQSGSAWACPRRLHGQELGKPPPLVGVWNIGPSSGWVCPSPTHAERRGHCLGKPKYCPSLPTFLLGHARLDLSNHVFGHAPAVASPINCLSMPNRTRPSKYLGCTWACPPSAQPAWARVWQDQVSPSPARVQPMQNVDWYCK